MTRVQGMGSTKSTNRNQGGGPSKQGIPSSVGRPANLMRFVMTNSNGGGLGSSSVSSTAMVCITFNSISAGGSISDGNIAFPKNTNTENITLNWKISGPSSFFGRVTNIEDSGPNLNITVQTISGTITADVGTTYTFTNC